MCWETTDAEEVERSAPAYKKISKHAVPQDHSENIILYENK